MGDLDGPLRVVRQNRNVDTDFDVPGVYDAHVHEHHLAAVDSHIGSEMVGSDAPIIVFQMDIKGFLRKDGDCYRFGEVHGGVR